MTFDVVCLSHLRWDFVYQRPQHLMSHCAREHRVFFIEEPITDEGEPRLDEHMRDGVMVVVPHLPASSIASDALATLLPDLLERHGVKQYVLWYYTPMALDFTRHLAPSAVVYDCMDELSAFRLAPASLKAREVELFQRADLVFCGGQSLYESKKTQHPAVHLFASSVDASHFAQARAQQPDPADQLSIPRPRLGFYGVLDERMDLDLVRDVAAARPDWHLVMIGPVSKIEPETLPQGPNIHYLGAKTYAELPHYLAGWDVAIMPFARNDSTRYISPTKTPEYLAAGRPVISTPIRDVVTPYGNLGLVRVAASAQEWIASVEEMLTNPDESRLQQVDRYLGSNSWQHTWTEMDALIHEVVERHSGAQRLMVESVPIQPRKLFDYVIVGAGFAGSVLAERLARDSGKRVLVIDRRNHVGGNAYDHHDDAGILIHRYGPHIFHTNSARVFDYLSHFTEWRPYQHRVLASVDGQLLPIPINLDTVNRLYGLSLSSFELETFFEQIAEPRDQVRTSEDVVVGTVGRDLYEKFFRGYTRKQWGLDPSELDASVTARVPTRTSRDDRYFTDTYQAMPARGYTRMFERMLDHPNIKVMLQTDYSEIDGFVPHDQLIYTGPIDEYFDFRFGKLPYRSLRFEFQTHDTPVFQQAPVVNYPNDYAYTRITEFKYLTGQEHPRTTTVTEYPQAVGDPYYPIPRPENTALYKRYRALADATPHVHFVGRLATYKYYNMDQVVAQALATYDRIKAREATDIPRVQPAETATLQTREQLQ